MEIIEGEYLDPFQFFSKTPISLIGTKEKELHANWITSQKENSVAPMKWHEDDPEEFYN